MSKIIKSERKPPPQEMILQFEETVSESDGSASNSNSKRGELYSGVMRDSDVNFY